MSLEGLSSESVAQIDNWKTNRNYLDEALAEGSDKECFSAEALQWEGT